MNNLLEQVSHRASQAFLNGQINEAIEIISSAITSSENILNDHQGCPDDHDMSVLFATRASYYNLSKKFLDALTDSETAISLDTHNVLGHVQKSKALFHLNKVNEAREAIHVGRGVDNDHGLFDELEKTLSNSWFTLGHRFTKSIAALTIAVAVGILINLIGGLSGWKQAIIVMVACLIAFFINLHRLINFLPVIFYALQQRIFQRRTVPSTIRSATKNSNTTGF